MGYHEISVRDALPPLHITGAAPSVDYTIDLFGMDDGLDRSPEATFRFLFQIGSGYMIYLWVAFGLQPGSTEAFHSFWVKDCAVAEIDVEEYGPPRSVDFPESSLPLVYERFTLEHDGVGERAFSVTSIRFAASFDGAQHIDARIGLSPLSPTPTPTPTPAPGHHASEATPRELDDTPTELRWSTHGGWSLVEGGATHPLTSAHHLRFEGPRST